MSNYDWVFGLNVMNIALGIVVVVPVFRVAYGLVSELAIRLKNRRGLRSLDGKKQARFHGELACTTPIAPPPSFSTIQ